MITMKAIVVKKFGQPEVLLLKTLPIVKPTAGQILVELYAAGVNPIDCYIRSGETMKPSLPYTPGFDGAGIIEEIGSGISKFKKGDRVFVVKSKTGTYAQYSIEDESTVFSIPGRFTFQTLAAIGIPYFTAYHALTHKCRIRVGETVLVHGASGGVGIACCQIAHKQGLRVFGTAGTKEGMMLVQRNDAHEVFDHHDPEHGKKIMMSTGGYGVNVIIEMEASSNMVTDIELCQRKGRIAIVGQRGPVNLRRDRLEEKDITVHEIAFFDMTKAEMLEACAYISDGLKAGWLKPVVGAEFPLEEAAEAHKEVLNHPKGARGKVILNIAH